MINGKIKINDIQVRQTARNKVWKAGKIKVQITRKEKFQFRWLK